MAEKSLIEVEEFIKRFEVSLSPYTSHNQNELNEFYLFLDCFDYLNSDNLDDAIQVIKNTRFSQLNKYLRIFLEDFDPALKNKKNSIDIWSQTNAAQKEYKFIFERVINGIIDTNIIPATIIDIGTGDGILLDRLLTFFTKLNEKINLLLIEPDKELISETYERIITSYPNIGSVNVIIDRIELVDFSNFKIDKNTTVVNASSVLHELSFINKQKVLNNLESISNNIFISELEGNHDLANDDFITLANSVYEFYSGLVMDTILSKGLSEKEKHEFINNYLIYEAYHILTNSYNNRINYHTTQEGWEKLLTGSSLSYKTYVTRLEDYLPNFFTFHLNNKE